MKQFLAHAPAAVPREYVVFLQQHGAFQVDAPSIGSGFVWFWELSEVLERNRNYRVSEFAPGLFAFGTDGAGELYVFDIRDPRHVSVGQVPSIPLQVGDYQLLASNFQNFVRALSLEPGD